ncbi:MAG: hypothetical protein AAB250_09160 [Bdellovibrionota bacterium]
MNSKFFSRTLPALACLSTLALAVACGRSGDNKNASIKEVRQEEVISQALKDAFPGYQPADKENIILASRLMGATLEVLKRDEKTSSAEAAVEVKLSAIMKGSDVEPHAEIVATGIVRESGLGALVAEKDKELPEGYAVSARCLSTSGCNQVLALITYEGEIAAGTTTADETTLDVVAGSLSTVSGGSVTEEKPAPLGKVEAPKQSRVAVLFTTQKSDGKMVIAWSASSTMGNFLKGGTRKSTAEARAEMGLTASRAAPAAADGGPQDPLPATTSGAADADAAATAPAAPPAPAAAAPVAAGSASSAAPVAAGSASSAAPLAAGSATAAGSNTDPAAAAADATAAGL